MTPLKTPLSLWVLASQVGRRLLFINKGGGLWLKRRIGQPK